MASSSDSDGAEGLALVTVSAVLRGNVRLLAATGAGALVLMQSWLLAGRSYPLSLDARLQALLQSHLSPAAEQALARAGTDGPRLLAVMALMLAALCTLRGRRAAAAGCLLSIGAALVLTKWVLKPLVDNRAADGGLLFPSTHATAAVACASAIALVALPSSVSPIGTRHLRWAVVVVAAATAALTTVGLVVGGYHYPSDVLGGAGVAAAVTLVAPVRWRGPDQASRAPRQQSASRVGAPWCPPHQEPLP